MASQPVYTMCAVGDVHVLPKMLDAAERYRSVKPEERRELAATASSYRHIFEPGAS